MDDAQPVPIPGIHDPSGCLPPQPPGHHPHAPPPPPPPGHHHGLPPPPPGGPGGLIPPSHMSPLPPGPPHMDHPLPPGGAGPFFHGMPPAPPNPKLGETNNNSMEKDLHGGGKGDEDESVDGDAEGCKGEDSENKSPDDGAGGKRRGPRTTIKASCGESVKSSDRAKARRDRTSKDVNEYRFSLPLSMYHN